MTLTSHHLKRFIEEKINPRVQGDGGEVTFVSFENNGVSIRVQGECSRCPLIEKCFKDWMVQEIKKAFGQVIDVKLIVKKPYFWDK